MPTSIETSVVYIPKEDGLGTSSKEIPINIDSASNISPIYVVINGYSTNLPNPVVVKLYANGKEIENSVGMVFTPTNVPVGMQTPVPIYDSGIPVDVAKTPSTNTVSHGAISSKVNKGDYAEYDEDGSLTGYRFRPATSVTNQRVYEEAVKLKAYTRAISAYERSGRRTQPGETEGDAIRRLVYKFAEEYKNKPFMLEEHEMESVIEELQRGVVAKTGGHVNPKNMNTFQWTGPGMFSIVLQGINGDPLVRRDSEFDPGEFYLTYQVTFYYLEESNE